MPTKTRRKQQEQIARTTVPELRESVLDAIRDFMDIAMSVGLEPATSIRIRKTDSAPVVNLSAYKVGSRRVAYVLLVRTDDANAADQIAALSQRIATTRRAS